MEDIIQLMNLPYCLIGVFNGSDNISFITVFDYGVLNTVQTLNPNLLKIHHGTQANQNSSSVLSLLQ